MKIIFNDILPFEGFFAINLFGVLFVRNKYKSYFDDNATPAQKDFVETTYNHEYTHTLQMKELLYIGFYLLYFIEWIIKLVASIFTKKDAYESISFEREAYKNERDDSYNINRHHFAWVKYIFKSA